MRTPPTVQNTHVQRNIRVHGCDSARCDDGKRDGQKKSVGGVSAGETSIGRGERKIARKEVEEKNEMYIF